MPTSLDPVAALEALTIIRSGGYFFPRSALSHIHFTPERPGAGTSAPVHFTSERPTVGTSFDGSEPVDARSLVSTEEHGKKLTAKQVEVLNLLRRGATNKLIARQLGLSEATVKVHVRGIMRKFGVTNRTQVAVSRT
jgi:DNA-binding NarL/FixJ family response regulator